MTEPVRIALFASGRGSNFRSINDRLVAMPEPPARIVLCISNNPNPGAFDYAREHEIETIRLSPKMFEREEEYAETLLTTLVDRSIEMIVLAGYMRQIPPDVVERYDGRILNIHPALLPDFGGKGMYGEHVHRAVIAAGVRESGVSVHLVDNDYDTGPVIAQERLSVLPEDTPETLAARILELEHRFYPEVVISWARKLAAARALR